MGGVMLQFATGRVTPAKAGVSGERERAVAARDPSVRWDDGGATS
jgi:hypothetical protein